MKAEITANAYVAAVPSALPGQTTPQTASTIPPAGATTSTTTPAPAPQVTP